jgi:hypothetical protein
VCGATKGMRGTEKGNRRVEEDPADRLTVVLKAKRETEAVKFVDTLEATVTKGDRDPTTSGQA